MNKAQFEEENRKRKSNTFPPRKKNKKKFKQYVLYLVAKENSTDKQYWDLVEGGVAPSLATGDPPGPGLGEANKLFGENSR